MTHYHYRHSRLLNLGYPKGGGLGAAICHASTGGRSLSTHGGLARRLA
ncbi:MAG: hypothetical protein K6U11_01145 [bacterium]|nr:hypothetical protein [bacterium]